MQTLIIGGGLCGLALANALEDAGQDYVLAEARNRFGGRIQTEHHGAGYFDMGPAWFWPHQPRILALIEKLGLTPFQQYADGIMAFEDERGQVRHGHAQPQSQSQVSWRLKGGLAALTDRLAARLPNARKRLNAQANALAKTADGITATFANGDKIMADRIVLALPPRIAGNMHFAPALPPATITTLQSVPTWMAGQAKAVFVYDQPFWRHAGLSGYAHSRIGPLVEIHDASPFENGPYALFGFIGVPPQSRQDEAVLRHHMLAQLKRLFGPEAAEPAQLYIKDWAFDPHTSVTADKAPLYTHPQYGLPPSMRHLWDGTLYFAGTETAPQFGGYIEGALEAAENTLKALGAHNSKPQKP